MKNRIDIKFDELRNKNQKALITFITSGDPNQKLSKKILDVLRLGKIDIIEIGFPFSDPMADGPTIQKSSQRAIISGSNLDSTFDLVADFGLREKDSNNLNGVFQSNFSVWTRKVFYEMQKNWDRWFNSS